MNSVFARPAFSGYGIELEYMIVDRQSLSIKPVSDELFHSVVGSYASDVPRGKLAWSNELVLHVVEIKNINPDPVLDPLAAAFHMEANTINQQLESLGACLMPTAMHPWMNPVTETHLWPHQYKEIYQAYDRIFGCNGHGWANLQSMHLNLPFANDDEFARLHAAIRLMLPIIPALAASSPIAEGRLTSFMDYRMKVYLTHEIKVPSLLGEIIPDTAISKSQYHDSVLSKMYRDIAPFDPEGVLRHEWLNSRGAIPRFDRNAIEIRVIDMQECPQADLAIAAAITNGVKRFYDAEVVPLAIQQNFKIGSLAQILLACIRDGEQAVIDDAEYLSLFGFPGEQCEAGELWVHLIEPMLSSAPDQRQTFMAPLSIIMKQGTLARRILRSIGKDGSVVRLHEVYLELCECLEKGKMYQAANVR